MAFGKKLKGVTYLCAKVSKLGSEVTIFVLKSESSHTEELISQSTTATQFSRGDDILR